MRLQWADRMKSLLVPGGVLIALEHPLDKDPSKAGPPFGLTEDVVMTKMQLTYRYISFYLERHSRESTTNGLLCIMLSERVTLSTYGGEGR